MAEIHRSSQVPHSGISTTSKSEITLNHSSEVIPPPEDISCPRVRSHTTTRSQLDFGLNAPLRGDLFHHHGQVQANFFESRIFLRNSILFLVQSHLTTQQTAGDSSRSPLQRVKANNIDTISTVTRIRRLKPNS